MKRRKLVVAILCLCFMILTINGCINIIQHFQEKGYYDNKKTTWAKSTYNVIATYISKFSKKPKDLSSPSSFQDEKSTINGEKTEGKSISESLIEEILIKEAWGDTPIIKKNYDKPTVFYSISEEGDLLIGNLQASKRKAKHPEFDGEDTVFTIHNIYNNANEIIKIVEWPEQIWETSINADWVVWTEGSVTGCFWQVFFVAFRKFIFIAPRFTFLTINSRVFQTITWSIKNKQMTMMN